MNVNPVGQMDLRNFAVTSPTIDQHTIIPRSFFRVMRTRTTAANDCLVRRFAFLAGFATLGKHPGRAAGMPAAGSPAFAAAHRMIDGILRGAAIVGFASHPALTASL